MHSFWKTSEAAAKRQALLRAPATAPTCTKMEAKSHGNNNSSGLVQRWEREGCQGRSLGRWPHTEEQLCPCGPRDQGWTFQAGDK